MCGIAGFLAPKRNSSQFVEWLTSMISAIHHRGPDQGGIFFDHIAGLGSARLAIIDIDHGLQPMSDENKRYWLVYNGEIFNYIELRDKLLRQGCTFRTNSDTEVLLNALIKWGINCLSHLNGQFSFLFYDSYEKCLTFARDPFGERPLFYLNDENGIYCTSEIKSLFRLPFIKRDFDTDAISHLFQHWALPYDKSCFQGVRSLPPGHYGVYYNGSLKISPYYYLPINDSRSTENFEEAKKIVYKSLKRSVQIRLRSDVEVGAYLSGGIDSSITTLLAKQATTKPLHTFSIEFADSTYDETSYQQELATYLGTQHHSIRIHNKDIVSNFEKAIWHAETALFRTAPVPMLLLSELVNKNGIKVVLTGEGADESFLGYNIFKETLLRHQMSKGLSDHEILKHTSGLYPYLDHFNEERRLTLVNFYRRFTKEQTPPLFSHEPRFSNGGFSQKLLDINGMSNHINNTLADTMLSVYPDLNNKHPLTKAQVLEFWTLLGGYLLSSQGDRMSSAHSLESRCPFLDKNVVETAWRLPHKFRLSEKGQEKYILKEIFRNQLPESIINRHKQPYRAPDSAVFLDRRYSDFMNDLLSSESILNCGIFDEKRVGQFVKKLLNTSNENISPREDQAFILLLSTISLHRLFIVSNTITKENRYGKYLRVIDGRNLGKPKELDHQILSERQF
ncbi:MAG: asparagine synthase (glutamine-hydrolyzing) [Flavobacteriaceae bacterium]|nr:MAG: asparagine synthase (glutamine-hydrolyzing) [Flavobacteriaceae bacterium]